MESISTSRSNGTSSEERLVVHLRDMRSGKAREREELPASKKHSELSKTEIEEKIREQLRSNVSTNGRRP